MLLTHLEENVLETEPEYTLRWPRELFMWEAAQLLKSPSTLSVSLPVLLEEAFDETDARDEFYRSIASTRNVFDTPAPAANPETWCRNLLASQAKLQDREVPNYWANRHGINTHDTPELQISLGAAFFEVIGDLRAHGYFPRVYPKPCVDQDWDTLDEELKQHLQRTTGIRFPWPVPSDQQDEYPEHLLYTLIEYFHDQAQRPRGFGHWHDYANCGWHYNAGANKLSGGVVYRWRINELLREHDVPLELSPNPGERGRLVRRLPTSLGATVDEILANRRDPQDEVTHAIRDYRSRNAGRPQRIAAVTLLAGELEKRKLTVREELLTKDESALFHIANEFNIRHRGEKQRADYSDDFLDWVFQVYVATVALADKLTKRSSANEAGLRPDTTKGAP